MPTERDYESDPNRYRLGMHVTAAHFTGDTDLYARVLQLLAVAGTTRALDAGSGDGPLAARAVGTGLTVVSLDAAAALLHRARRHGPAVRADVTALPFADETFDAVIMLNVLDHLPSPEAGLVEARRMLRPGGVFIAGTVSREDSPELAPYWRPTSTTFDTEDAPELVANIVGSVRIEAWNAPLITLPDRDALRDFLVARFVPVEKAARLADALAERGPLPLPVTKRGALLLAHLGEP